MIETNTDPPTTAPTSLGDVLRQLVRRITGQRSAGDAYVAGVLGGQADRFHIDPLYLRIGVVVAAVLLRDFPVVPPLYAMAWIVIPKENQRSLLGTIWRRSSLQEVAAAALSAVLASLVLADERLWVAAVLAVVAWALLDRAGGPTPERGGGEGAGSQAAAEASPGAATEGATAEAEKAAAWGRRRRGLERPLDALKNRPARAARPRRQPALWPLGLAALLAVTVVFWTVDQTTTSGLDPSILVNLGLLVIGGVIALSGWKGRVGLLPLVLVPLVIPWLAFSVADIGRFPGTGDVTSTVGSGSAGGEHAEVGYGTVHLVVPDGRFEPGETIELSAAVTAGRIVLDVPANANVTVAGDMGMGSVVHRSPHHWDTSFVVRDQLERNLPAIQRRCADLLRVDAWDVGWMYPDWPHSFLVMAPDGESFSAEFLDYLRERSLPEPQLAPPAPGGGSPWLDVAVDQYGQACDPEVAEPEQPVNINLEAKLGLGELTIVRS